MVLNRSFFIRYLIPVVLTLAAMTVVAQSPVEADSAPVPPALKSARTLFISNAGSDSGLFPSPFSGTSDRPYSRLYAGLSADHAHQLVSDPSQADLVLELRLFAPAGPQRPNKQNGASDPLPMLRLVIYDRKSHFILWTLTQSVNTAALQKTHDRNLDTAIQSLVNDFESLTQ